MSVVNPHDAGALKSIVAAGLLCGCLDLTAALLNAQRMGLGSARVLQFIASGVLGPRSFNGGAATAALGVAFHYTIAFGASTVYYLASRQFSLLVEQPFICGPVFGIAVFLFMNVIVLPLSATPKRPMSASSIAIQVGIHMVCVGLAIALAVSWASR